MVELCYAQRYASYILRKIGGRSHTVPRHFYLPRSHTFWSLFPSLPIPGWTWLSLYPSQVFKCKPSSRYRLLRIFPIPTPKLVLRMSPFFEHVKVHIELSLQSCALLVGSFPDRGTQPRKHRPYFRDARSHPKVFSPLH